ncbi:unnamed protein product [Miscanthus lutarioriparius]|uniref:Uncharacterized protein n=1 Tax=Miscanthus lutarioriparius TaxID=422564 RepID=A0A811SG16_9POAL|nr:unnamed protein product [Miscanthus lutarioriparius]
MTDTRRKPEKSTTPRRSSRGRNQPNPRPPHRSGRTHHPTSPRQSARAGIMVAISMYRGNLHIGGHDSGAPAPRRWEAPRRSLGAKRFRRLVRNRSRAVERLAGTPPRQVSTTSSDMNGGRRAADPDREGTG